MIEINNLTTNRIDERFLKRVAKIVLKGENKKEARLSVVLVGEGRIKELNKKYRGKNKVTDVLSFGEGLNEIVICFSEVKKNAKRYNSTFKKELARVLIHGILHLLGYEHEKPADSFAARRTRQNTKFLAGKREAKKMEKKQKYYLSQII